MKNKKVLVHHDNASCDSHRFRQIWSQRVLPARRSQKSARKTKMYIFWLLNIFLNYNTLIMKSNLNFVISAFEVVDNLFEILLITFCTLMIYKMTLTNTEHLKFYQKYNRHKNMVMSSLSEGPIKMGYSSITLTKKRTKKYVNIPRLQMTTSTKPILMRQTTTNILKLPKTLIKINKKTLMTILRGSSKTYFSVRY